MVPGYGAVTVDMAGAMALVAASGVPGEIAAELLTAAAEGIRAGVADRKEPDA